jgi:hypothetical protein
MAATLDLACKPKHPLLLFGFFYRPDVIVLTYP